MKTIIKLIFNISSWVFLGAIFLIAVFTIGSNTNLLAGYKSFMILSGSMEPSILIGDIVATHRQNQYFKNDVITFYHEDGRIVTHRIVAASQEKDQTKFITKGDANRDEDDAYITQDMIIGKVIFVVPKLGYFVNFAKSLPGLITLIIIPCVALILDQILKLKK